MPVLILNTSVIKIASTKRVARILLVILMPEIVKTTSGANETAAINYEIIVAKKALGRKFF